jgi:hypothetical protein
LDHGELTEEQPTHSFIPTIKGEKSTPRHEIPLKTQRAVVVTHKESFQRYLDQMNKGLQIGVTTSDPQEKEDLQKAVQLLSANIKKAAKIERKAKINSRNGATAD